MGDRMRETERPCVKAEAFGGVGFCAVFCIADDGAASIGEVNADLVAAAGH